MHLRKFPLIAAWTFLNYEYRWTWIRRSLNESYTTWPPGWENKTVEALKKTFSLIWDFLLCYFFWAFFQFKLLYMWALSSLLRRGLCSDAGKKESGARWEGEERREAPAFSLFPSSPARFLSFRLLLLLLGYPAGAYAEESERLV